MSDADILKWNAKYRSADTVGCITPDPELPSYGSLLPPSGKALDLACGLGNNALWMAQQGLLVTAIDGSELALENLWASARTHGLMSQISTRQADLDNYQLADNYFDLIVVVRYLNRSLLAGIAAALKPGGVLVYKTFNQNILKQRPGFNLAYTIEITELMAAFSSLEILADNRDDAQSEYAFMMGRKRVIQIT